MCTNANFCGELVDGQFQLKRQHYYFHQVQLQLYMSSDVFSCCDLCIYPNRCSRITDITIQGVRDEIKCMPEYFDKHMLPEIVTVFARIGAGSE